MSKLEAICETFKEHLATVVADQLRSDQFQAKIKLNNALKGLSGLTMTDLTKLREISRKPTISTADVDYIITKIVRRDPSAEFAQNHTAFSDVLEKYRATSDLLAAANDVTKFRRTYYHLQDVIKKLPDGQTTEFIKAITPVLGESFNQDRLFAHDVTNRINNEKTNPFNNTKLPSSSEVVNQSASRKKPRA